jgi:hypothetical protein
MKPPLSGIRLFAKPNVESYPDAKILQILGEGHVQSILYEQNGVQKELGIARFSLSREKSASAFLSPSM